MSDYATEFETVSTQIIDDFLAERAKIIEYFNEMKRIICGQLGNANISSSDVDKGNPLETMFNLSITVGNHPISFYIECWAQKDGNPYQISLLTQDNRLLDALTEEYKAFGIKAKDQTFTINANDIDTAIEYMSTFFDALARSESYMFHAALRRHQFQGQNQGQNPVQPN